MVNYILHQAGYFEIFLLTLLYFLVLYFFVGKLFIEACKFLEKRNLVQKIIARKVEPKQIKFEVKHSLKSIFIFGFSSLPIIFLYRNGYVDFSPNTLTNIIVGLLVLNVYNEFHFFIIHRIMHLPFFMKKVHWVHHQTRIPTIYSVYSFHWLEAFLLSTVPLSIVPLFDFSAVAVGVYPFTSILLNFSGHCNYRFGKGNGYGWQLLGTNHNHHHSKGKQNFGFAIPLFDFLNSKIFPKNERK